MSGESQLTFSDISNDHTSELYEEVSSIAALVTETATERAGDNCATVTQKSEDNDYTVFYIKLPPRTTQISSEDIQSSEIKLSFHSSTNHKHSSPPYTTWEFIGEYNANTPIKIVLVSPTETVVSDDNNSDEETSRTVYTQFDFADFVSKEGE